MTEKQCGTCKHWKEHILQVPESKGESTVLDLSNLKIEQPRGGECRFMPPQLVYQPIGLDNHRRPVFETTVSYPHIAHTTPACSQHAPVE